jgi:hypothetical protein
MTTVEEIERAVEQLTPHELARFRAWAFDAGCFGGMIEQDARAGILAVLAEEAVTAPETTGSRDLLSL